MVQRSRFSVRFFLYREDTDKAGLCPIRGRITVNGTRAGFSCRLKIDPALWGKTRGRGIAIPTATLIRSLPDEIRETIIEIEQRAIFHYKRLLREKGFVTALMIKNASIANRMPETFLKLLEKHNTDFRKRVGVDRTYAAYDEYLRLSRTLQAFLHQHYGKDDIRLQEIDISFINAFDLYLRRDKGMGTTTVYSRLTYLRKIMRMAVSNGTIDRDPFMGYRFDLPRPKHKYLTADELSKVMSAEVDDPKLAIVRDLYVFSCFTGLAYCDIDGLGREHVCAASDGGLWIIKKRDNTGMESKVMLLDIPRRIIEKYVGTGTGGRLFDMPNKSDLTSQMRELSRVCGVERHLSFGTARAGFATQVMLKHNVPVETISRMMGYKSAVSARKYIGVSLHKISSDMKILEQKLGDRYSLPEDADYDKPDQLTSLEARRRKKKNSGQNRI